MNQFCKPTPKSPEQVNSGAYSRIAGNNYVEGDIAFYPSMDLSIPTTDELNERAIENEYFFRKRFGSAERLSIRKQIIAIKDSTGFTDEQIRSMRTSGHLVITGSSAKLIPNRWMPVIGWFYWSFLSLGCVGKLLELGSQTTNEWNQALELFTIGVFWLAATWFISRIFLTPWRLLKQAGVLPPPREKTI